MRCRDDLQLGRRPPRLCKKIFVFIKVGEKLLSDVGKQEMNHGFVNSENILDVTTSAGKVLCCIKIQNKLDRGRIGAKFSARAAVKSGEGLRGVGRKWCRRP